MNETNEMKHKVIEDKISGCLDAMIRMLGDPMTIELGILTTLTYIQKENLLADMKEAMQ
tara:strand:- start:21 stop:197 length:177 start_codon:yes stop_codon:yes gene_type:complete